MIFAYKEEFIGPTHNYIKITQGEYKTGTLLIEKDNTLQAISLSGLERR